MNDRLEIKSLKKALRALTYVNQHGDATVTDVAKAIDVPRATSYRLLETLAAEGYLQKQPHSDYYRITSMVLRLSAGFEDDTLLIEVAKPLIEAAQQELGWPLCMATPRGAEVVVHVNTDHDSALALERYGVGGRLQLLYATGGYCYLAHCAESERDALLALAAQHPAPPGLPPVTPELVSDRIAATRERGFCNIEYPQFREGNVAVPLWLAGRPMGAVVMRYIKSALHNTGRLESVYVPRLHQLVKDIDSAHAARSEGPMGR